MGSFSYIGPAMVQAQQSDIARKRGLADELRQQNLQRNWGILNDPSATPDMKQTAGQSIASQYPTPDHKDTFLQDIFHLHGKNQAAQAASSATPAPSATPVSGSPGDPSAAAPSGPAQPAAFEDDGGPESGGPSAPAPQSPPASAAAAPNFRAVAAAPTPQAAMSLWQQYRGPAAINEGIAEDRAKNAAGFAQKLAETNNAARIQEATIRAHGNVSMQKMDAAAQSLGAEDFASASPEIKMQAMKAMATANRAPAWKAVTDGNTIYAVNSLDPNDRKPIGHKDDITTHLEYKTLEDNGRTYQVPFTVWTKKGSSVPLMETQDQQASSLPMSTKTPQGPSASVSAAPSAATSNPSLSSPAAMPSASSNPGARQPGTRPIGGAVKKSNQANLNQGDGASSTLPKGAIPFGNKPSILDRSDATQYTKLAEDANDKQKSLQLAQNAARSPSPSSDQQLIYSWVRANVQGAGRMTQQEFSQAAHIGGFQQKAENWLSMASSGKLTPEIRQMLLTDIRGAAANSQQMAQTARAQVEQDMHPGSAPKSSATPGGPGAWSAPKDAPAPVRPNQVLKANGQVVARSLDGKTWSQP
jgi:hypothetical protein